MNTLESQQHSERDQERDHPCKRLFHARHSFHLTNSGDFTESINRLHRKRAQRCSKFYELHFMSRLGKNFLPGCRPSIGDLLFMAALFFPYREIEASPGLEVVGFSFVSAIFLAGLSGCLIRVYFWGRLYRLPDSKITFYPFLLCVMEPISVMVVIELAICLNEFSVFIPIFFLLLYGLNVLPWILTHHRVDLFRSLVTSLIFPLLTSLFFFMTMPTFGMLLPSEISVAERP